MDYIRTLITSFFKFKEILGHIENKIHDFDMEPTSASMPFPTSFLLVNRAHLNVFFLQLRKSFFKNSFWFLPQKQKMRLAKALKLYYEVILQFCTP